MPIQDTPQPPLKFLYKKYRFLRSEAQTALPRDKAQSQLLLKPAFRKPLTGPMTGQDIKKVENQPHHIDGNLTLLFAADARHKAYASLPVDHPNVRLPYSPGNDAERVS